MIKDKAFPEEINIEVILPEKLPITESDENYLLNAGHASKIMRGVPMGDETPRTCNKIIFGDQNKGVDAILAFAVLTKVCRVHGFGILSGMEALRQIIHEPTALQRIT